MATNNQIEVTIVDGFLNVKNITNPDASIESYNLAFVTSVNEYYQNYAALNAYSPGRFPNAEEFTVIVSIEENPTDLVELQFDIQNVTNQAGWTIDRAGLAQAVADVKAAAASAIGGGGSGSSPYTAIGDGRKVVALAGTAEALGVSTVIKSVTIQAELNNTGVIAAGSSTVVADEATRTGSALEPGDTITIDADDLAKVFIDSTVDGDGVTFILFN